MNRPVISSIWFNQIRIYESPLSGWHHQTISLLARSRFALLAISTCTICTVISPHILATQNLVFPQQPSRRRGRQGEHCCFHWLLGCRSYFFSPSIFSSWLSTLAAQKAILLSRSKEVTPRPAWRTLNFSNRLTLAASQQITELTTKMTLLLHGFIAASISQGFYLH